MGECEICGKDGARQRANVDKNVFRVCEDCVKLGKAIDEPAVISAKSSKNSLQANRPSVDEMVVENFPRLISLARQKAGLRQEELATKLNERLSELQALETGKRSPTISTAKKFEKFFHIKLVEEVE